MTTFTALSEDAKDAVLSGQTIDGTIQVAIGAASVCWGDDGTFISERALEITNDLKLAIAEYLRIAINQQSLDARPTHFDAEQMRVFRLAAEYNKRVADSGDPS